MATKKDSRSSGFRSSAKRDLSSRGGGRPGRPLLLILVVMVALTGGMFLSGNTTPRLGIDLAGGTSITLEARADEGNEDAINATNMETAVSIIERRVNGLGVSEAEVQTQGDRNIIVNIPRGTDEQEAREQVGTTAELGFRPVLTYDIAIETEEEESSDDATDDATDEESSDDATDDATDEATDEESSDEESSDDATDDATDEATDEATDDEADSQSMPAPDAATGSGTTANMASYVADDATDEATDEATDDATDEESSDDATDDATDEESSDEESSDDSSDDSADDIYTALENLDCSTDAARLEASRAAAAADDEAEVVTCDTDGIYKYALGPVAVPGRDVNDANAVFDSQTGGGWIVQMEFNDSGTSKFADITEYLSTQYEPMNQFAIVLDGEVVSAPSVSERLGGGRAEISGSFNQESAEELANILKYGALPLNFEEASVSTVSPTLGGEQLRAGLIAGAIGLCLVVLYLVLYYRGLSLIAFASLVASAILTYAIMSLLGPAIGFALNLPAVCGAIVAIGITADSFIVYFERIRDEIREGRTLRPAVERAWPRARRTILVSDFVSFLAAAVLFMVTVGKVQGFAFTLGLTTLLDVAVVFLFTKPLMTLMARRRFFATGHPWSGLDPRRLGARSLRGGRRPAPVPSDPKEA